MRRVLLFVVIVLAAVVGWQIGGAYVDNYEFSSDLKDLAAQNNARTGLEPIDTEAELKRGDGQRTAARNSIGSRSSGGTSNIGTCNLRGEWNA